MKIASEIENVFLDFYFLNMDISSHVHQSPLMVFTISLPFCTIYFQSAPLKILEKCN